MGRVFSVPLAMAAALVAALAVWAAEAPLMKPEQLQALLGRPDVVVIDVRRNAHWDSSGQKIKGAVRRQPGEAETWGRELSPDKTYVLYCA